MMTGGSAFIEFCRHTQTPHTDQLSGEDMSAAWTPCSVAKQAVSVKKRGGGVNHKENSGSERQTAQSLEAGGARK